MRNTTSRMATFQGQSSLSAKGWVTRPGELRRAIDRSVDRFERETDLLFGPVGSVSTGWGPESPGFSCGEIHEVFGLMGGGHRDSRVWVPPIAVLTHFGLRSLLSRPGPVVWIGRQCWPYGRALVGGAARTPESRWGAGLLDASIFVDAPTRTERIESMEIAMRAPGVSMVIADGRGIDRADAGRLRRCVLEGGGVGLLAKPTSEVECPSIAASAWRVSPVASTVPAPRWTVSVRQARFGSGLDLLDHVSGEVVGDTTAPWSDPWTVERVAGGCRLVVPARSGVEAQASKPAWASFTRSRAAAGRRGGESPFRRSA